MKTTTSVLRDSTGSLISKLGGQISGVLHGFDRLRLRGTLRPLYSRDVMEAYLNAQRILIKDFGQLVERTSAAVRAATHAFAESWNRPVRHLNSSQISKEQVARQIAQRDGVTEGLIAVLSAIEPCKSFSVVGNRQTKQIELKIEPRKCLHFYFYFEHKPFGFMHVRLQTWFPFQIDVCLNGRHWLANQLGAEGIGYRKRENAIIWCQDLVEAQRLLDLQIRLDWCKELDALVAQVHPLHEKIRRPLNLSYYWTVSESEYASDLLFRRPEDLARIYPSLVHHALRSFSSPDVMRFLGRKVPTSGQVDGHFQGEIISDLKHRPEGIRVKHSLDGNSIKLYDKQGSVLHRHRRPRRPETVASASAQRRRDGTQSRGVPRRQRSLLGGFVRRRRRCPALGLGQGSLRTNQAARPQLSGIAPAARGRRGLVRRRQPRRVRHQRVPQP
jgi:hypothetical protein